MESISKQFLFALAESRLKERERNEPLKLASIIHNCHIWIMWYNVVLLNAFYVHIMTCSLKKDL